MFEFNNHFCNKIAQLSIKKFNDLPKTGKPNINEWTILSSITKLDNKNNLEIVALGTGSKCIGANKMSAKGDILNDSHAEIICRRAFLRYLYSEINSALKDENKSIFIIREQKFLLRNNITFHFFTTHVPCGDAAIFPKQNAEDFGNCLISNKNNSECTSKCSIEAGDNRHVKRMKIEPSDFMLNKNDVKSESYSSSIINYNITQNIESESDIFRTGAKCLANDVKQDSKQSGSDYHTIGAVRTKPGRGEPTLSVSCSDKLAKWTFLGIQGALLSYLLSTPVYLTSFTIVGNVPFSQESLMRSLKTRFDSKIKLLSSKYKNIIPLIGQADVTFPFCKHDLKRPCPSSLVWSNVSLRPLEISVDGKKQGVTKKNRHKKEGRLLICKKELFSTFVNIIKLHSELNLTELQSFSYKEVKTKSEYCKIWNTVKTKIFTTWTVKNEDLLNFTVDEL